MASNKFLELSVTSSTRSKGWCYSKSLFVYFSPRSKWNHCPIIICWWYAYYGWCKNGSNGLRRLLFQALEMKEVGHITYFLMLQVQKSRDCYVYQQKYLNDLITDPLILYVNWVLNIQRKMEMRWLTLWFIVNLWVDSLTWLWRVLISPMLSRLSSNSCLIHISSPYSCSFRSL